MSAPGGHQIVTFRLGDDLFAADINDVERVLRYADPTPVPNVPSWVEGVIEYRSRVVPVIDLRTRFELAESARNGATRLMVLSSNGDWIAAVVDAVLEVVSIGNTPLAPPPPLFEGMAADFIKGILRRDERLIIVLDVTRLLATKERLTFDREVLASLPGPADADTTGAPESPGPAATAQEPAPVTPEAPPPASEDLLIIRGSPDPAALGLFPTLGSDDAARDEDPARRNGPAVPQTPEWGTAPSPRTWPLPPDDEGGGTSNG